MEVPAQLVKIWRSPGDPLGILEIPGGPCSNGQEDLNGACMALACPQTSSCLLRAASTDRGLNVFITTFFTFRSLHRLGPLAHRLLMRQGEGNVYCRAAGPDA